MKNRALSVLVSTYSLVLIASLLVCAFSEITGIEIYLILFICACESFVCRKENNSLLLSKWLRILYKHSTLPHTGGEHEATGVMALIMASIGIYMELNKGHLNIFALCVEVALVLLYCLIVSTYIMRTKN